MLQVERNESFENALRFVNQTSCNVFVTGKAGTGKTTFLRYLVANTLKKMVVAAPTGVAAIHAGGVTIHSLFQLPFGIFIPDYPDFLSPEGMQVNNKNSLLAKIRMAKNKRKLLQEMEVLVLDEVSMVKADMLDAIDTLLKHVRNKHYQAFGGVQLVFIGDLYQLPPVVNEYEWSLLSKVYKSPFFFDAQVMSQTQTVCIEFDKIYRQKNTDFVALLNRIRENQASEEDLKQLNQAHYNPDFIPPENLNYITLCSHNAKADRINNEALEELDAIPHIFEAEIKGEFQESAYPTVKSLELKEGAQVMFIKNDTGVERKYFNGKLGKVDSIIGEAIYIRFEDELELLPIEKVEWENIRYSYNEKDKKIEEDRIGTFKQYPIRLAWAVTIHKSQGLTFERAIVDAGSSFSEGQVYVALSRLSNPEGLVLQTRIHPPAIKCSQSVVNYMLEMGLQDPLDEILEKEERAFSKVLIIKSFEWNKMEELFVNFRFSLQEMKVPDRVLTERNARKWAAIMTSLHAVAIKFIHSLQKVLPNAEDDGFAYLSIRLDAAVDYFVAQLENEILLSIVRYKEAIQKEPSTKKFSQMLQQLQTETLAKKQLLLLSKNLVEGLKSGKNGKELFAIYQQNLFKADKLADDNAPLIKVKKTEKGDSIKESIQLFKEGRDIETIATQRSLSISTIEGHMAIGILKGEIEAKDLLPEENIAAISKVLKLNPNKSLSEIRQLLKDAYSFTELRYVANALKKAEVNS